jgi:polyhomeotic-like protein 2
MFFFQAQQSNLVQVARSLGRAVPLSPQLIFTPTATVTAVQSESSTQSSGQQSAPSQVPYYYLNYRGIPYTQLL